MFQKVNEDNKEELLGGAFMLNRLLARAAYDLGLEVEVYDDLNMFRVQIGNTMLPIRDVMTPLNTYAASSIANNKFYTSAVWSDADIPVAKCTRISRKEFLQHDWDVSTVEFPLVIKPTGGTLKGNGVVTDIRNMRRLQSLLKKAFQEYNSILVEEYAVGLKDYRVLVLEGKVLGVLERVPAFVIGNGRSTIGDLIERKNKRREKKRHQGLGPIKVNQELRRTIEKQGFTIDTGIPKKRQRIQLKNVCNLGAGGEVHDVTHKIDKQNVRTAIAACKALNLSFAGLDFLCEDISKPLKQQRGHLIEANANPDIAMHLFPESGTPRNIAMDVMKALKKQCSV